MTKSKKRQTITKQNIHYELYDETQAEEVDQKKRGRKSRPSVKIYTKPLESSNVVTNVILHLKCSLNDLNAYNAELSKQMTNPLVYNPEIPPELTTYDKHQYSVYEETSPHCNLAYSQTESIVPRTNMSELNTTEKDYDISKESVHEIETKELNQKLKRLKINLYKNNLGDKKAACFWCTYEFDNETCYIPKYAMDDNIHGYGSFCRPECAAAFLMKENLDDSTKFERYHLLNQVYAKVYNYKKSIKPAPDPHYLLDKFYGNMTIQEYRKLLKSEHLLMVLEKPLTRILPELHEDNEEIQNDQNRKQIGMYKVKRQTDKSNSQSKASILKEHFGLDK